MTSKKTMERPILVVDDEPQILLSIDTTLRMAGLDNIITISDSRDVMPQMERRLPRLIILDLNMPHINGERLLKIIKKTYPQMPVIILTGAIDVEIAVKCMKIGALDYLVKPVKEDRLVAAVKQALENPNFDFDSEIKKPRASELHTQIKNPTAFEHIITQDKKMHSIFHYIEAVAPSSQPVLVLGETGVGKELMVQPLHQLSRRKGNLIVVNVAGLDDNVFSDTLFGHVVGAFTGADKPRQGLIEQAAGGTLFLDEIGDLTLTSQIKLLRLLQEGEYLPLGSDKIRFSDARIIASTNHDLWALEKKRLFRKDLIYRLSTHIITLPPLRDRIVDLPLLLDRFVCEAADELDKPVPDIPKTVLEQIEKYPFKGNVRELKSMVYDAVSRHTDSTLTIDLFQNVDTLPLDIQNGDPTRKHLPTLKEASKQLVKQAMEQTGGNQSAAAVILGISQQALSKRLKKIKEELNN